MVAMISVSVTLTSNAKSRASACLASDGFTEHLLHDELLNVTL